MDNNQIEMIEKDKKSLKKLWGFLAFFVLLMMFLLYFRVWLGLEIELELLSVLSFLFFLLLTIYF